MTLNTIKQKQKIEELPTQEMIEDHQKKVRDAVLACADFISELIKGMDVRRLTKGEIAVKALKLLAGDENVK